MPAWSPRPDVVTEVAESGRNFSPFGELGAAFTEAVNAMTRAVVDARATNARFVERFI